MIEIRGVLYQWYPETDTHWSFLGTVDGKAAEKESVAHLRLKDGDPATIHVHVGERFVTTVVTKLPYSSENMEIGRRVAEQALILGMCKKDAS